MDAIIIWLETLVRDVHPFAWYLIAANVVTFVAFSLDYAIVCIKQDESTGLLDGRIMTLFAVVGGAWGMLLALAIYTRGHMNKDNIAWWFCAILFSIIWLVAVLCWSGVVPFSLAGALSSNFNTSAFAGLGIYLVAVNIATFVAFCTDKRRAERHAERLPEAALLGLSLAGGSLGGLAAMHLVHHKTRKWYFTRGLPAFMALHVGLFAVAHGAGWV